MAQPKIFISYRRDDAAGYARAVNDALVNRFGADAVFIDVDDIHAGQPFSEVIQRSVGGSAVLLALIGKRWLGEREGAAPRIADDADFVRREVAAGLAHKEMRVVPVLLDGTTMPEAARLPPDLHALAGRNALELDNTRFAADMDHLLREVEAALGEEPAAPPTRGSLATRWLAVAALAALVVAAVVWELRSSVPEAQRRGMSTARVAVNGEWRAQVEYDWPNARYVERFVFMGEGDALQGSASFLGVARGVLEGSVDGAQLRFVTRTSEMGGADAAVVHRYRGQLVGDELRFVMQTEGGSSAHVPVEFVARRPAASAPAGNR